MVTSEGCWSSGVIITLEIRRLRESVSGRIFEPGTFQIRRCDMTLGAGRINTEG